MRREDDPFDHIFRELERMMNEVIGDRGEVHTEHDSRATADDIHLDVSEEDDVVSVVADLPGVNEEAIDLTCDGQVLAISTASDTREFADRVRFPVRVNEHTASVTYNNGILKVTFERADNSANIDLS